MDDHPASDVDPDLVEADVDLAKAALRVRFLAARRGLAAPVRATADAAVRAALRAALPPGPVIAAYVPVGAEPGGPELPDVLAATGRRVLLPVLCNDLDLDWAAYEGPGCLVPASRGLREPTGPRLGRAAVASADAVVVPAVAVDRAGVRLGRGGGSYDRVLARVPPGVPVIALLYDGELCAALPAGPHDRRVTAVVTPSAGFVPL